MVLARQSRVALAIGAAVLLGGWLAWAALRLPRAPRPVERAPDVDASVAGPGSAPDAPSTEPAEPDAPARGSAERHDARPASPEPATARPARGIEGELLDVHTGLPVPGARVALAADDGAVEAAEDGRFALPGAAVPDEAALAFAVTLDTGERFELEHAGPSPGAGWIRLEVAASYELRGTVVDAAERGIGGAAVCLLGRGSAGLAELGAASSDEAGAFALRVPTAPNLSPSTLLVSADAAALFERPVVFDRLAVDLGRVPLEDGWAISGRVVGPHDASVPASVEAVRRESSERDVYSSLGRVHWEDGRAYRERARAPVRENGLFELRGLDRASYALRLLRDVRCNRPDPGGALVVTAPARDVALPDSRAVLLLEVVDAHGEALALAELRVGESPTGCPADRAGLLAVALPAGELDATVTCPGFLPQELRRTLVPGSVVRERVVLAGELVTGTLVVSAVDTEGEPIPHADVRVYRLGEDGAPELRAVRSQTAELPAEGMRFDDVPAGRLLVQLNPNTVITGYAELTVPTEREVELAPDATLRVAVKDPAGELVTAWMRCVRADTTYDRFFGVQGTPATFVGFNGGVLCRTMEALPPGTWRFEASADGRRPASQDVDVVAGREVAVELVLALGEH